MRIELSEQQIKDLLFIIDNSTFKGATAEKVVKLKEALNAKGLVKGEPEDSR